MALCLSKPRCVSGDECDDIAVESSMFPGIYRFCQKHQDQLDRIREEVKTQAHTVSSRYKDHVTDAYCETPGCPNRPVYTQPYCTDCNGD